jgi:serine/threonine-protein kinase
VGSPEQEGVRTVGRYALHGVIAAGGMATVHLGRLLGPVGFSRTVAIKRLHAQFASDPEFVSMFLDEARLVARIRHPNVIPTLDVVATSNELFLVMEYVAGESLARLLRVMHEREKRVPVRLVSSIITSTLHGLHAAHEARDERGSPLNIVHRDVSPQNILVGLDGVTRVIDFGVAKAAGRIQTTRDGQIKGKLAYMAPEQLLGETVTRRADVYSASVVLWELSTGQRLFSAENEGAIIARVLKGDIVPPSLANRDLKKTLTQAEWQALEQIDAIVMRGLSSTVSERFATAKEMAVAIERLIPPATASELGEWVEEHAKATLSYCAERVAEIESGVSGMSSQETLVGAPERTPAPPTQENETTQPLGLSGSGELNEGATQTRVSIVTTRHPEAVRPRATRSVFSLAAMAIAILAILGFFVLRAVNHVTAPTASEASSTFLMTGGPPSATAPVNSIATPAATSDTTAANSGTTAIATPSAASSSPRVAPGRSPKLPVTNKTSAPAPVATAAPAPADECNPPYTWGEDGIKLYKKQCSLN